MSTRKEGYYWVKSNGYWYIDEWSTGRWVDAPKQGYDEIDENQIVRIEPIRAANPMLLIKDELPKSCVIQSWDGEKWVDKFTI